MEKQLPQLTTLDLQYVSPQLLKARNLELAMPGAFPYTLMHHIFVRRIADRYLSEWQTCDQDCKLCHQIDSHCLKTTPEASIAQGRRWQGLPLCSERQAIRQLLVPAYSLANPGHEDLRQDERVMQLFSLVNTLLSVDTNSFKRRLHIQRYAVIPLAPNAGLMGWVKDSDTLHVLVRDYRDSRKVLLNIEYRLMLQV